MIACTFRRLTVAAAILTLAGTAYAQQKTSITGTVSDSTGKPMAGVKVQAMLPGRGDSTQVVTDQRGAYSIPVELGDYQVSATMAGFRTESKEAQITGRVLTNGTGLNIDFTLTPTGAAAAAWQPNRLPDGQPDVQGFWNDDHKTGDSINYDVETGHRSVEHYIGRGEKPMPDPDHAITDPADGRIPYTPAALAKRDHNEAVYQNPPAFEYVSGRSRCWLPGSPGFASSGNPQIIQSPGYLILMIEYSHEYRIIRLDDSPHIGKDILLMSGDSRGHWEGNTLVVDVANSKGQWLDLLGNFRTDAAHIVERYTFESPTRMKYEATVTDPEAYTQPTKFGFNFNRSNNPNFEFYEDSCHEGNADVFGRLSKRTAAAPK